MTSGMPKPNSKTRKTLIAWSSAILGIVTVIVTISMMSVLFDSTTRFEGTYGNELEELNAQLNLMDKKLKELNIKEREICAREEALISAINNPEFRLNTTVENADMRNLELEISVLHQEIEKLGNQLSDQNSNLDITKISDNYTSIDNRLSLIETAIIDSPERSLALYTLSNEIENLDHEIRSIMREIDRLYEFTKWFLALMLTMALGVLGLALTILLKKPEK